VLVDQHFTRGVVVDFLGRPALVNPLLAKLARHPSGDDVAHRLHGTLHVDAAAGVPRQGQRRGQLQAEAVPALAPVDVAQGAGPRAGGPSLKLDPGLKLT
jgi:hypothetical protein